LYGRYPIDFKYQNSDNGGHQVSPKDLESQSFSFLAFKEEAVGMAQMYRRKKIIAQIMFILSTYEIWKVLVALAKKISLIFTF
jgi:hypothetical protein